MRSATVEGSKSQIKEFMKSNSTKDIADMKAYAGIFLDVDNLNLIKIIQYPDNCLGCEFKKKDDTNNVPYCNNSAVMGFVQTDLMEPTKFPPKWCPLKEEVK